MSKPSIHDAPCVQDYTARLEISILKERMKTLEEVVLAQEATIERLRRLIGALR